MATFNLQISIKDSRIADIKPCLERAIDMPMMEDPESTPENPLPLIPMFTNTKALIKWWLERQLRRAAKQGYNLLQIEKVQFNDDFIE